MRAVVDTNVWVSALINPRGAPAQVLGAYRDRCFTLITSEVMLEELREVLSRPRIAKKYGVRGRDVDTLVDLMRRHATMVEIRGEIQICRDPDDDVLIEVALIGKANALVSRDEDLARAPEVSEHLAARRVRTLTVRRFLEELS